MTTNGRPRRLLGIWAHPDDETYLSAALMRRVVASGGHVTVVTATSGELGGPPDEVGPMLGRRRRCELATAMAALGVDDVRVLDHADGACEAADRFAAAAEIGDLIRSVRPDTIVTFGPDGITGHPDHVAVSRWTSLALEDLGARVRSDVATPRVLHATMTTAFVERSLTEYPELPLTVVGEPDSIDEHAVACRIVPTPDEWLRKCRALDAHASQMAPLHALVGRERLHAWWRIETFRAPAVHTSSTPERADHGTSTSSPDRLQAPTSVLVHSDGTGDHAGGRTLENRTRP